MIHAVWIIQLLAKHKLQMWLQGVAIALPRVQDHYGVSDQHIGWLSASVFLGMMIGAIAWGSCTSSTDKLRTAVLRSLHSVIPHVGADIMGRSTAFNATLLLTSIFGLFTVISSSYLGICFSLFLLGTSVGVTVPVFFPHWLNVDIPAGFNADGRNAVPRKHSSLETLSPDGSLRLLLPRCSPIFARCCIRYTPLQLPRSSSRCTDTHMRSGITESRMEVHVWCAHPHCKLLSPSTNADCS